MQILSTVGEPSMKSGIFRLMIVHLSLGVTMPVETLPKALSGWVFEIGTSAYGEIAPGAKELPEGHAARSWRGEARVYEERSARSTIGDRECMMPHFSRVMMRSLRTDFWRFERLEAG